MDKIYDKAFKFGFVFSLVLMFILNLFSWTYSVYEFSSRSVFLSHDGYSWGFPFEMYRNFSTLAGSDVGFTIKGVLLNCLFFTIFAFIFGFYFRYINKSFFKFIK
ncbi:MAG: hypothetical protein MUC29_10145 [Pyrinomonadaceae bacterium]|jgi:hypothetical protein|nr:hypothetical protein [Pyrinomonadaceae bacterium]